MLGEQWTLEHWALACAGLGAWDWDIAQDRLSWSERMFELLGVNPATFDPQFASFEALLHPEDRETFTRNLMAALGDGHTRDWRIDYRVLVGGQTRWMSARGRISRDDAGAPRRIAGVLQDVTEHHVAERAQRESAALMQAALDASLFAVVVLEPSGQIIYCNDSAAQLLGLTRSSVESRTFDAPQWKHTDLNGGPWPQENQPFLRVLRTGEKVVGIEHRIERPDGRSTALRINGAPIKDAEGNIRLLVFSFEDITERLALEQGLRQAQKLEAIGRLSAGVAHDFNNLLTVILTSAELAVHNLSSPRALMEMLDSITEAGERATALTRQLLAFARKDVGRPVVFDLVSEVKASVRLIERLVGERVRTSLRFDAEPVWVRMDPNQLQQVLINLAANARDAMRYGGTLALSIESGLPSETDAQRWAIVRVEDSGSGMDEATLRRCLEPFFTTKEAHEGTGIGLSTCQSIVLQAGGTLHIESAPGKGTRVEVRLPQSAEAPVLPAHSERKKVRRTSAKLLLVEDVAGVRQVARRALEEAGYEVHAATDAVDARRAVEQNQFDLVICDVELADADGAELVAELRKTQPRLTALLVSGFGPERAQAADEYFLAKPYTGDALVRRVSELLSMGSAPS